MRAIMPEGRTPGGGAKNSARRADVTTLANYVRDFEGKAQPLRPKPHLISINVDQT